MVGSVVAGIETQFENVYQVVQGRAPCPPLVVRVNPYHPEGLLERSLPFLPASTRGSMRSFLSVAPLFRASPFDVIWSLQVDLPLLPWLATVNLARHVPIVYTADSTPRLLHQFGPHYGYWGGRSWIKQQLRQLLYGFVVRHAALVNPWTEWAARSLRDDYGVEASRLRVLPPGVDVDSWRPGRRASDGPATDRLPRLLFVGGDFERKGGDVLLTAYREQLRGKVEIDLVTRTTLDHADPALRLHTGLRPNDTRLRDLYQQADIFVLPTQADCFSMAGMEALASGLPVVTCPVGGVAELFQHGRQGYFVPPGDPRPLAEVLQVLVADAAKRRTMAIEARALAVERYDARKNTARLLAMLESVSRTAR